MRGMKTVSALFERPQTPDLPPAVRRAAGFALHPGLRRPVHVARQKIATGIGTVGIGGGKRRDIAAGPGVGILPRDAGILGTMADHVGCGRTCIGKVSFGERDALHRDSLPTGTADRAGRFRVGVGFGEAGVELVGAAGRR